jgi:hypothetical protein
MKMTMTMTNLKNRNCQCGQNMGVAPFWRNELRDGEESADESETVFADDDTNDDDDDGSDDDDEEKICDDMKPATEARAHADDANRPPPLPLLRLLCRLLCRLFCRLLCRLFAIAADRDAGAKTDDDDKAVLCRSDERRVDCEGSDANEVEGRATDADNDDSVDDDDDDADDDDAAADDDDDETC